MYILTLKGVWFYGVKNGVVSKPSWILGEPTFGTTVRLPKNSKRYLLTPIDTYKLLILLEMETLGS
jgi:hypothetical protein